MPYTSEVFGISTKMNEHSYVDRNNLDEKFKRLLRRDTHIAIKGPSKCGKSWLRQKCLENTITIQCRINMTTTDIYKQALSKLGKQFDISRSGSHSTSGNVDIQGEVKVPLVANTSINGTMAHEEDRSWEIHDDFSCSSDNLEYFAHSISTSKKRLVIEDFHYLNLNVRERLAYDLKTLWDYKCFVIIIGVWTQTNLLTALNPDLSGRIEELSVSWENDELLEVIQRGSSALNIEIDPSICNDLVNDSFGNVGILQSLLLKLVEDEANIEKTSSFKSCITNPSFYKNAAEAYATQLDGLYQQFAKNLSAGIRNRESGTGIYALAMEAIVGATDEQLLSGFKRDDIYNITHLKESRIQKGNLKTVLRMLVKLQGEGKNLVISYDEAIDSIIVVDYQLLFYRKYHTMLWPWEELVEEARKKSDFEEATEENV